jgi:hypothetical protein
LSTSLGFPHELEIGGADDMAVKIEISASESDPYFDPVPANDSASAYRVIGYGGCGLLGIEAPIALGLVRLVRGRRSRRTRRSLVVLAGVALAGVASEYAAASPLAFTVDTAASQATLSVDTPLGAPAPVPIALSGTLAADVDLGDDALFGPHVAGLQLLGGALALSDAAFALENVPLYALALTSEGLVASVASASIDGLAVSLGTSLFDAGGAAFTLGSGRVAVAGTYFGLPVTEAIDLGSLPSGAPLPADTLAQVRFTDLGDGSGEVELRLPYTAQLTLTLDGSDSVLTLAGTMVAHGALAAVPEPGTGALLAAGLAGIAVRARRDRRTGAIVARPPR